LNGPIATPKDEVLARITEEEKLLAALDRQRDEVRGRLDGLRAELVETRTTSPQIPQLPTCHGVPTTATEKLRLFRSLFRGRGEIFPTRFVSKTTGKPGYAPACSNKFVRGVCGLWVPEILAPVFQKIWHRPHPEGQRSRVSSALFGLTDRRG
jgi:hypothetical protein